MPRYNLRIGNQRVSIANTDTALSKAIGKRLAGSTPETNVDNAGGSHTYNFSGQDITFEDLRDIKDIRDSGGQVAQLMSYKSLLNFGEGAEIHVEDDDETEQIVDGQPMTLGEWLETEAFPRIDLTVLEIGEDALWYPAAYGELRETRAGDFKEPLAAEPWTILPETDDKGEITRYIQRTKTPGGGYTKKPLDSDDLWSIVLNRASARDKTGISEVLRNKDEIQAFKENEQAINQAIELHGFPQRHVKVGEEDGAPVRDDDLRRVRTIFDPHSTDANTAYFTGQDVDVETLEAHQFDYTAIHEMDMRNLTTALGLPLEAGNVGSDGLGSGKPAELRFSLLKLAIKANQRSFGVQFVEDVMRPVVRDYSPFDHTATITLDIADPLEDIGEVADLIGQIGEYMTNEEIRQKLDMPAPEDDEIAEGYRSPADMEAPEDEGGPLGGGGGSLFRQARSLAEVPDNAVSISDRSEAPDDASVIEGPGGGLYYVPGGGGDADDAAGGVVDGLPDTYDGSREQRKELGGAAKELAESGASYQDAVSAIESEVDGMDTLARKEVRQQAYINQTGALELGGEEVETSPVVRTAYSQEKSELRQASREEFEERVIDGSYGVDEMESIGGSWQEAMGGLYNSGTAALWATVRDATGNDKIPDGGDPNADDFEREVIQEQKALTEEVMRDMFGETVPVSRGVHGEFAEEIRAAAESGEEIELEPRALESWSTFPDHAEKFASDPETGEDGVMITTEIPVEDVWLSSHTTPGLAEEENELVVGGDSEYVISPEDVKLPDSEGMVDVYDDVGGKE